jgi:hypothetical protein
MQRIRILGLVLVAMFALSGLAVSSASASLFLVHPTGKILGEAVNPQVFKAGEATVSCSKADVSGTATALRSLTVLVAVLYGTCKLGTLGANVTPAAQFILNADLLAAVENTVTIEVPEAKCSISIGPAGNQALNSVHYGNEGSDLKVNALVKGITFTTTGGLCGAAGENATYNGEFKVMSALAGGVVRWDK